MTLRARLLVALTGVLAAAFLVFGVLAYRTLERTMLGEEDGRLAVRANSVAHQIEKAWPGDLSGARYEASAVDLFLQVARPDGDILYRSPSLESLSLPLATDLSNIEYSNVTLPPGRQVRCAVVAVLENGQEIAVVSVGEALDHVEAPLTRSLSLIVMCAVLTLMASVAMVLVILSLDLAPLIRVARVADDIVASGDVSKRVPVTSAGDEVGRVAVSFNVLLERVEQMLAAQKRLLADTSHELRNPLTVICTDLDLLEQNVPEQVRLEVVREAAQEAERMRLLIRDLLLLSTSEMVPAPPLEPIRLDVLIADMPLPGGVQREVAVPVLVRGDRERLRQIAANLIDNALRYARDHVTVSVDEVGGKGRLVVTDDGPGIAAQHLPHVFERFYQVDAARSRQQGGAGLGLAIVKAHVESLHGTVQVTSEAARGTRFECLFPLDTPP